MHGCLSSDFSPWPLVFAWGIESTLPRPIASFSVAVLILHSGNVFGSNSLSLSCSVLLTAEAFDYLDAPAARVTGADVPMPYAKSLEDNATPRGFNIVNAVKKVLQIE